jgi:hypothetical protein
VAALPVHGHLILKPAQSGSEAEGSPHEEGKPARRGRSASSGRAAGISRGSRTGVCGWLPLRPVDDPGAWLCALGVSGLPSPPAPAARMPFVLTTPGGQPVPLLETSCGYLVPIACFDRSLWHPVFVASTTTANTPPGQRAGYLRFIGVSFSCAQSSPPPPQPTATMDDECPMSTRESVC